MARASGRRRCCRPICWDSIPICGSPSTSYSAYAGVEVQPPRAAHPRSAEYGELFPDTTIKRGSKPPEYIRTADEVEIVGHEGSLLSVGREGSLTGNRVDCFLLDDLYKDAMEANSPLVRENCWEWYTSVVRTRMHNDSREMLSSRAGTKRI